jgi:hypothetical protein
MLNTWFSFFQIKNKNVHYRDIVLKKYFSIKKKLDVTNKIKLVFGKD